MRGRYRWRAFVSGLLLVAGLSGLAYGTRRGFGPVPARTPATSPSPMLPAASAAGPKGSGELRSVEQVVWEFGQRLRKVSLLAPADQLATAMKEHYGDLVASPALLDQWVADPRHAPGRFTSSPWPDRIEILAVERHSDTQYQITGAIIEVTSVEALRGGQADSLPVTVVVDQVGERWLISDVTVGVDKRDTRPDHLTYQDDPYGLRISLPGQWQGYGVVVSYWEGYRLTDSPPGQETCETGPLLLIRHPLWTEANPRQDLPVMVFTIEQWNALQEDKFHIGAAPVNPRELARNQRYVFALPARYNFAFLPGYEEVDQMVTHHAVSAFAVSD